MGKDKNMEIDYKQMLVEYMQHVVSQEGTSFLDSLLWEYEGNLTKEELQEFKNIDNQI